MYKLYWATADNPRYNIILFITIVKNTDVQVWKVKLSFGYQFINTDNIFKTKTYLGNFASHFFNKSCHIEFEMNGHLFLHLFNWLFGFGKETELLQCMSACSVYKINDFENCCNCSIFCWQIFVDKSDCLKY